MSIVGTLLRSLGHTPSGGSAPATPTLSLANVGDGDAVTATVDGAAGVTNTLLYRKVGATAWTTGSGRSGDGTINQTGLDDNTWYCFVCVSSSGAYNSLPSLPASIYCTSGTTSDTTNILWGPLENMRTLIAASATFQAWVGATGGTEAELIASAKASVYLVAIPGQDDTTYAAVVAAGRPFALLSIEGARRWPSGHTGHAPSGEIHASFESDVSADDSASPEAAAKTHTKQVGLIVHEMEAKSAEGGYPILRDVDIEPPIRTPEEDAKEYGDAFVSDLILHWGIEGS